MLTQKSRYCSEIAENVIVDPRGLCGFRCGAPNVNRTWSGPPHANRGSKDRDEKTARRLLCDRYHQDG
jgi:hypothetical protein